ncbi:hypothetical protein EDB86DRAFT_2942571 [Lactarius hatsudake]|nr:hypothetical protein EDB86DRAFT_2942571 [Lactarius hatsudake]
MASYDTLASLFELMQGFLQRLEIYIGTPLTPAMVEVLGKIMAEVLSMKQRRFKKYLKRLVGRTDVENALMRLDVLTQREMHMAVARNLEVTHGIDDNVKAINTVTCSVDINVRTIREGGRARNDLRKWISPPNPSINHNLACDYSPQWHYNVVCSRKCVRGVEENSSLLWIRGIPVPERVSFGV